LLKITRVGKIITLVATGHVAQTSDLGAPEFTVQQISYTAARTWGALMLVHILQCPANRWRGTEGLVHMTHDGLRKTINYSGFL